MFYISRKYGSKSGFLRLMGTKIAHLFGHYNSLYDIEFDRVERLVFVCKGNICRSAYANAYLLGKGLASTSCGLEAVRGGAANHRTIDLARVRGVDLRGHMTQHIDNMVFMDTDLLLGMEPAHMEPMRRAAPAAQISLLGLWGAQGRAYIHDPYSASEEYFKGCLDLIENSVDVLVTRCYRLSRLPKD